MRSVGSWVLSLAALLLGAVLIAGPAKGDERGGDPFVSPMDYPSFGDPDTGPHSPQFMLRSPVLFIILGRAYVLDSSLATSRHTTPTRLARHRE